MNKDELITVLENTLEYKELTRNKNIKAIIVTGSVIDNSFIDGWSDIDLVVITTYTTPDIVLSANKLKSHIQDEANLKIGISIIEKNILLNGAVNLSFSPVILKYYKLYINNQIYKGHEILHSKGFYFSPLKINPKTINIIPHIVFIHNSLLLTMADPTISDKLKLRKLIKNIIFLAQTGVFKKSGVYLLETEQILSKFNQLYPINIISLKQIFAIKYKYKELPENIVLKKKIDILLKEYKRIYQYLLR